MEVLIEVIAAALGIALVAKFIAGEAKLVKTAIAFRKEHPEAYSKMMEEQRKRNATTPCISSCHCDSLDLNNPMRYLGD